MTKTKTRRKQLDCAKRYDEQFKKFPLRLRPEQKEKWEQSAKAEGYTALSTYIISIVEKHIEERK